MRPSSAARETAGARAHDAPGPRHPGPATRRIVVIGTTGSGKSTLAARISGAIGAVVVELDDLHWLPGWQARPEAEFEALVRAAVAGQTWVVAGNYGRSWPWTLPRAELVVWLDRGFWLTLGRLTVRTARRIWTGVPVCNGNFETVSNQLSRDSIFVWFLRTYFANRRRFAALAEAPGAAVFLRLRREREIEHLLARLRGDASAADSRASLR